MYHRLSGWPIIRRVYGVYRKSLLSTLTCNYLQYWMPTASYYCQEFTCSGWKTRRSWRWRSRRTWRGQCLSKCRFFLCCQSCNCCIGRNVFIQVFSASITICSMLWVWLQVFCINVTHMAIAFHHQPSPFREFFVGCLVCTREENIHFFSLLECEIEFLSFCHSLICLGHKLGWFISLQLIQRTRNKSKRIAQEWNWWLTWYTQF